MTIGEVSMSEALSDSRSYLICVILCACKDCRFIDLGCPHGADELEHIGTSFDVQP